MLKVDVDTHGLRPNSLGKEYVDVGVCVGSCLPLTSLTAERIAVECNSQHVLCCRYGVKVSEHEVGCQVEGTDDLCGVKGSERKVGCQVEGTDENDLCEVKGSGRKVGCEVEDTDDI